MTEESKIIIEPYKPATKRKIIITEEMTLTNVKDPIINPSPQDLKMADHKSSVEGTFDDYSLLKSVTTPQAAAHL